MSYTYDGVLAEVEYRRDQLMTTALPTPRGGRLFRWHRAGSGQGASPATREQVRDGTAARGYDLAA